MQHIPITKTSTNLCGCSREHLCNWKSVNVLAHVKIWCLKKFESLQMCIEHYGKSSEIKQREAWLQFSCEGRISSTDMMNGINNIVYEVCIVIYYRTVTRDYGRITLIEVFFSTHKRMIITIWIEDRIEWEQESRRLSIELKKEGSSMDWLSISLTRNTTWIRREKSRDQRPFWLSWSDSPMYCNKKSSHWSNCRVFQIIRKRKEANAEMRAKTEERK